MINNVYNTTIPDVALTRRGRRDKIISSRPVVSSLQYFAVTRIRPANISTLEGATLPTDDGTIDDERREDDPLYARLDDWFILNYGSSIAENSILKEDIDDLLTPNEDGYIDFRLLAEYLADEYAMTHDEIDDLYYDDR